jgi:hypothetical protein
MIISSLYKSLQRTVVEMIDEFKKETGHQNFSYWSWENRADENELPKENLVGIGGFDFEENEGLWVIKWSIGLSPWEDLNLDKQITMLDVIHRMVGHGRKIAMLDPQTGAEISQLVVSDFNIAPATTTEFRNYRVVSMEMLRTDSATPG